MNVYVWISNVLMDYTDGMMVVVAQSEDEARRLAEDYYCYGGVDKSQFSHWHQDNLDSRRNRARREFAAPPDDVYPANAAGVIG